MLPYGALWKLDHMLHPAAAPRARTPQLRRRRAFLLFLFAALLSLMFLIPFHGAHLRRVYTQLQREAEGLAVPLNDPAVVQQRHDSSLDVLRQWRDEAGEAERKIPILEVVEHTPYAVSAGGRPVTSAPLEARRTELNGALQAVLYFTPREKLVLDEASGLPYQVDSAVTRALAGAGTLWTQHQSPHAA